MVGGVAVEAGGVIGPIYEISLGLEPRAVAVTKLVEGASVAPGQQLFGWVNWRGTMSPLLDVLDRTIFSIIRPRERRLVKG